MCEYEAVGDRSTPRVFFFFFFLSFFLSFFIFFFYTKCQIIKGANIYKCFLGLNHSTCKVMQGNNTDISESTSCPPGKIRSPEHCLKLERWQGPPHINKVKQYETVLSFEVSLLI